MYMDLVAFDLFTRLTPSQTSPGFYVSAVQVFSKHCGKRVSCCNDVINHVGCVIKRDVYPQKMHSYSKNIRGI